MGNKIIKAIATFLCISLIFMTGYNIGAPVPSTSPDSSETIYNNDFNTFMRQLEWMQPSADGMSVAEIYRKCVPSVVLIQVSLTGEDENISMATGTILTSDGYILTNAHVINPEEFLYAGYGDGKKDDYNFKITLYDDTTYNAVPIAFDTTTDIGILKINPTQKLVVPDYGNSGAVQIGDLCLAIGNPFDVALRNTLTVGFISGIRNNVNLTETAKSDYIQTDATLNPGNSGGPLINASGQVIGINSMKIVGTNDEFSSLGFAVPSNLALKAADDLILYGYVRNRVIIGINVYTRIQKADEYGLGLYISSIYENSDAYIKGLRIGDIIVEINGIKITKVEDLSNEKDKYKVGDMITLKIFRYDDYDENEEENSSPKGKFMDFSFRLIEENPNLK